MRPAYGDSAGFSGSSSRVDGEELNRYDVRSFEVASSGEDSTIPPVYPRSGNDGLLDLSISSRETSAFGIAGAVMGSRSPSESRSDGPFDKLGSVGLSMP